MNAEEVRAAGPVLPSADDSARPAVRPSSEAWPDIRVRFLSELAKRLHQYGATTPRLEAFVEGISVKLGLETQIWSGPTVILLSFKDASSPDAPERGASEVLRLTPGETNLRRLVDTDEVAERVYHGRMSPSQGYATLRDFQPEPIKFKSTIFGFAFAAASVAGVLKSRYSNAAMLAATA